MKKAKPRAGTPATTVGMINAALGYECYDPNDDTAAPIDVIGWLINEVNGKHVTLPITMFGDPPDGWEVRYKLDWTSPAAKDVTNANEAT